MNEEIKDPNQLDLFVGILRTPEQEKMINDFLEHRERSVKLVTTANQQNEKLLIDNGFIFESTQYMVSEFLTSPSASI